MPVRTVGVRSYRVTAIGTLHPFVVLFALGGAVLIPMLAPHPLVVGSSLVCAVGTSLMVCGARATANSVRWQLVMVALVLLVAPLMGFAGQTHLFSLGMFEITAEALVQSAVMAGLMVATLLWLSVLFALMPYEAALSGASTRFGSIVLVSSLSAQLMPELVASVQRSSAVEKACTAAYRKRPTRDRVLRGATLALSWALDESIGRADVLRGRGWRAGVRRSSLVARRMRTSEQVLAGIVVVLVVGALIRAVPVAAAWSAFPRLMPLTAGWWLVAPLCVSLLPLTMMVVERVRMRRCA